MLSASAPLFAHAGDSRGHASSGGSPSIALSQQVGALDSQLALRLEEIALREDSKDYAELEKDLLGLAAEIESMPAPDRSLPHQIGRLLKSGVSKILNPLRPRWWRNTYYHYAPKLVLAHLGLVLGWEAAESYLPLDIGTNHGFLIGALAAGASWTHQLDRLVWPILYHIPKTFSVLRKWARLGGYEGAFDFYVAQAGQTPFSFDVALGAFPTQAGSWILVEKEKGIAETLLPKVFFVEHNARRAALPTVSVRELESLARQHGIELPLRMEERQRAYALVLIGKIKADPLANAALESLARSKTENILPLNPSEVSSPSARRALAHLRNRAEKISFEMLVRESVPAKARRAFMKASRKLYNSSLLVHASSSRNGPSDERIQKEAEAISQIFDLVEASLRENGEQEKNSPPCSRVLGRTQASSLTSE